MGSEGILCTVQLGCLVQEAGVCGEACALNVMEMSSLLQLETEDAVPDVIL